MEVVLIGCKGEELEETADLLGKPDAVDYVLSFEQLSEVPDYLQKNHVELIFLDADDTEVSWIFLCKKIKDIDRAVRVVLISRNDAAAVKAYDMGLWDYLLKPLKRAQLERVIRKTLKDMGK